MAEVARSNNQGNYTGLWILLFRYFTYDLAVGMKPFADEPYPLQ